MVVGDKSRIAAAFVEFVDYMMGAFWNSLCTNALFFDMGVLTPQMNMGEEIEVGMENLE